MTVDALTALVGSAADSIDPAPITAWLVLIVAIFAIIAGICAAIAFGWKWIALPALKQQTAPIQPDANGGKSLADLHRKVDDYRREVRVLTDEFRDHLRDTDRYVARIENLEDRT